MEQEIYFLRQNIERYQCDECKKVFNESDKVYYLEMNESELGLRGVFQWYYFIKLCKDCIINKYVHFKPIFLQENKCSDLNLDKSIIKPIKKGNCIICKNDIIFKNPLAYIIMKEFSYFKLYYGYTLEDQDLKETTANYIVALFCWTCYKKVKKKMIQSNDYVLELTRAKHSN